MLLVMSPAPPRRLAHSEQGRRISGSQQELCRRRGSGSEPGRRVRLLEMAQHWAHVAEMAERNALLPGRHGYDNPALSGDGGRNGAE